MNIRAIAIDLDHTLFNSQLEIPEKNVEAIKLASQKGLYIIIATGRMPIVLHRKLKHLLPYIDCMIAYNGAMAMDVKTQELIYAQSLPSEACADVISKFSSEKYNVMFFSGDHVFSRNVSQDALLEYYVKRTGAEIALCSDQQMPADKPIHKFCLYDLQINQDYNHTVESPLETVVYHRILEVLPTTLQAIKTRLGYVECIHKEVSKFNSIDKVLSRLGIDSREHLMAIGDAYNDIDMVKNAKLGVAIGNAVDALKNVAKLIVSDNDNAGVAQAIYKAIDTYRVF
jgi:Cof subfamily protein (haloacid dehalogenase superfamily)